MFKKTDINFTNGHESKEVSVLSNYKQRKKRNLISRLLKFVIIMFELEFSLETAK
ncbi:hypothetical protein SAMN05443543_101141 [Flavobacterium flevense]|uniref:Uncharacterized protein n=1 Tax=Flavobacterium flevense TaxID=983 RepID=A0A4Y4B3Z1_9FLAO|nr:hypothetical protein FFL01_31730 [Flavobacterium flevense]SHL28772.1 hypothetical protein SAMN05443543_101141 [Flavobacterium flevense]